MRPLAWALPVAIAASGGACDGCGKTESAPDVQTLSEPAVPAPAGVLAEFVLVTPDATWARVQRGIGGIVALMAPTVGGVVASLIGADSALGAEIDGGSAAYGVLVDKEWIVGLRVRNAARVKEILAGDAGGFKIAEQQGGLVLLEPGKEQLALGIAQPGWLIVGKTKEGVSMFGPYVYRTLPTRPLPRANLHADFGRDAFMRWLKEKLDGQWEDLKSFLLSKDAELRQRHGGRDPDFGDARAIVDVVDGFVRSRVDAWADMQSAMLDLDLREDDFTGALTIEPGTGPSKALVEGMRPGETKLGPVPNDTVFFALFRDDLAGRQDTMRGISDGFQKALGNRLTASDAKVLSDALAAWAAGRGDWLGAAVTAHGVLVRTPAKEGTDKAVRDILALADKPAFLSPLDAGFGFKSISFAPASFGSVGKGTVATLPRDPKRASPLFGSKLRIGYVMHDEVIDIGFGSEPEALVSSASDDTVAEAITKLGPDVSFFVAGRAQFLDPLSSMGVMRQNGKIVVALDVAPILLRQLLAAATMR